MKGDLHDYIIIQRLEKGKWVDCSCHYFYSPKLAFREYDYLKLKNPEETYRIAKGKCKFDDQWENN